MEVKINGESRSIQVGISIQNLLLELGIKLQSVVVEHNKQILDREKWKDTILKDQDCLEIVRFVGGG